MFVIRRTDQTGKYCSLLVAAALFLSAALASAQAKPSEWDKVVEAGRKEGKVVASIPPSAELRKLMELSFPKHYGIGVEFVPARGGDDHPQEWSMKPKRVCSISTCTSAAPSRRSPGFCRRIFSSRWILISFCRKSSDPKHWWGGYI